MQLEKGSLGNMQEVGLQPAQQEQQRIMTEFGSEISLEALNHMEVQRCCPGKMHMQILT